MHLTTAKTILNNRNGMNIYRGCSHGCVYCDSRSACYRFTHSFEDIEVKQNAPELLERVLKSRRKKAVIGTGSMCDPYQHCEKELLLMRRCLEIIDRYGFGATVITKSDLVLRDMDLFRSVNEKAKAVVQVSLTVADESLSSILEPNVCNTKRRYEVLKELQKYSVPTVVWLTPLLPFITDNSENIMTLLDYCFDAGVKGVICFGVGMTLRSGNREYYYKMLDKYFPGLKRKYESRYGDVYELASDNSDGLMRLFHSQCEKRGVLHTPDECFRYIAEWREKYQQMSFL